MINLQLWFQQWWNSNFKPGEETQLIGVFVGYYENMISEFQTVSQLSFDLLSSASKLKHKCER